MCAIPDSFKLSRECATAILLKSDGFTTAGNFGTGIRKLRIFLSSSRIAEYCGVLTARALSSTSPKHSDTNRNLVASSEERLDKTPGAVEFRVQSSSELGSWQSKCLPRVSVEARIVSILTMGTRHEVGQTIKT